MMVENDIPEGKYKENTDKSGFGLENIKRRLEIEYPEKYNFEIRRSDRKFIAELKIDCTE
jgi:LytS/YehU family sensor histidine kinase